LQSLALDIRIINSDQSEMEILETVDDDHSVLQESMEEIRYEDDPDGVGRLSITDIDDIDDIDDINDIDDIDDEDEFDDDSYSEDMDLDIDEDDF